MLTSNTPEKQKPNPLKEYPTVTIVVRAFNAEKYIADAIRSIMLQTYEGPIEVVVCFDEGSRSQMALEIVKRIAQKNTRGNIRFKIVRHPNMPPFRALVECGLRNASGDFIGFLDYDNVYSKIFVEKLLEKIIKYSADVAVGRLVYVDEFLKPIKQRKVSKVRINLQRLLMGGNILDMSSMILSKKCIERLNDTIGKYLESKYFDWLHEDYLLALIVIKEGFKVVVEDEAFYLYRIHQASSTGMPRYNDIRYYFSLERSIKTIIAFYNIYRDKLTVLERLILFMAILKRMCMLVYGILRWILANQRHKL